MRWVVAVLGTMMLTGATVSCAPAPESPKGFRLPDGDPVAGEEAFIGLGCYACHMIEGVNLPSFLDKAPMQVVLGGKTSNVKTYGELVTSIINPSHKLASRYPEEDVSSEGESFMPIVNKVMTVQQLVDVVAFLQLQYEVTPPEHYPYSSYAF